MNQDLERMINNAGFEFWKPKGKELVKDFARGVYDTAKQYVTTKVQQVAEDIKDITAGAKNAAQRVELTSAYINALDQRLSADLESFEVAAIKQYGEGFTGQTTEEGYDKVMSRISIRYHSILRRLKARLMPFVDSDTKPNLPDETFKKLAGMIIGYEINDKASRIRI